MIKRYGRFLQWRAAAAGQVAAQIGVSENTVWNWEQGIEPEVIHIPAVLAFLGYVPWGVLMSRSEGWRTSRRSRACHCGSWGR